MMSATEIARRVIWTEIEAPTSVSAHLDSKFSKVVHSIEACKERLVVVGMDKLHNSQENCHGVCLH